MAGALALKAFPPKEALEWFRRRGLAPSFNWQDTWAACQQNAFAVAGITQLDLVRDFHSIIEKALKNGMAFADFQKSANKILRASGWWGSREVTDPITGRKRQVDLSNAARLETIYRTNFQSAFNAGRYEQIQRVVANRMKRGLHPGYLKYDAIIDEHNNLETCPTGSCRKYNGLIRPVGDKIWTFLSPPIHHRCRCTITYLSPDTLNSLGYKVSRPPVLSFRTYVNQRTGQTSRALDGVSPGFGRLDWKKALQQKLEADLRGTSAANRKALKSKPAKHTPEMRDEKGRWTAGGASSKEPIEHFEGYDAKTRSWVAPGEFPPIAVGQLLTARQVFFDAVKDRKDELGFTPNDHAIEVLRQSGIDGRYLKGSDLFLLVHAVKNPRIRINGKLHHLKYPTDVAEHAAMVPVPRKVARVVILDGGRVWLQDPYNEPYVMLPGGGVEGDESFEESAIREAKEETGIDIEIVRWLADFDDQYAQRKVFLARKVAAPKGATWTWQDADGSGANKVYRKTIEEALKLLTSEFDRDALKLAAGIAIHAYNPDEPRDAKGKWGRSGGASSRKVAPVLQKRTMTSELRNRDSQWKRELGARRFGQIEKTLREDMRAATLCVRVTPGSLDRILADGRFKTQFETHNSRGKYDPKGRAQQEHNLFNMGMRGTEKMPSWDPVQDVKPDERPIYGYLMVRGKEGMVDQYGMLRCELKPEVREAASFAGDDTLSWTRMAMFQPSPINAPRVASLFKLGPDSNDIETRGRLNKVGLTDGVNSIRKAAGVGGIYFEAQIHRRLTPKDIASISVPDKRVVPTALRARLEELHIPINVDAKMMGSGSRARLSAATLVAIRSDGAKMYQVGFKHDAPIGFVESDAGVSEITLLERFLKFAQPDDWIEAGDEAAAHAFRDNEPRDEKGRWIADTRFGSDKPSGARITKGKGPVFKGEPVSTRKPLSKSAAGKLGEKIALEFVRKNLYHDARAVNGGRNNTPYDLFGDHHAIEVKTGQISNGKSAQHWRVTFDGKFSQTEQKVYDKLKGEAKRKWNEAKGKAALKRKIDALKKLSEFYGVKIKPIELTVIVNPDTRRADLFMFDQVHLRVAWKDPIVKKAYRGTFKYAAAR